MIKKIGFDIDDTLNRYHEYMIGRFLSYYRDKYKKDFPGKMEYEKNSLFDIFPGVAKEDIEAFLSEYRETLQRCPLYRKHLPELFKALKSLGVEIHIVTARGSGENDDNAYLEKVKQLTIEVLAQHELHLGKEYDELHIGFSDKENIIKASGIELMVEDDPKWILSISKSIPVFIMDMPYNRLVCGDRMWRIYEDDLVPKIFIEKIKYAMDHIENDWNEEVELTNKNLFSFGKDTILVHADQIKKSRIIFVASATEHPADEEAFISWLSEQVKKPFVIHLDLLNKLDQLNDSKEYEIIRKSITYELDKNNVKDINDPEDVNVYIAKTNAIKKIVKYAENHGKEHTFIIVGHELMMVSRQEMEPWEKYPFIIRNCGEREIAIAKQKNRNKGYNGFLLFEDITEISTQLRKWRIIAGTAKKELLNAYTEAAEKSIPYINRQWCDSDGVDRVNLLKGEKPYHPEALENILNEDVFCIGDLHLSTKDPKKTELIVKNINRKVRKNDHLLFLGDFDGKKGTGSYELVKSTLKRLNTKNIYLILGNNDPYPIEAYAKLGFKTVTDYASFKPTYGKFTKIHLTHCALPVEDGELSIHGHIHGSRCYWNVDWTKCVDVWDSDFYPVTIKNCIDRVEQGLYEAVTEIHKRY